MAGDARSGLKLGLRCNIANNILSLNGWGRPFGIETLQLPQSDRLHCMSKWLGTPVRD